MSTLISIRLADEDYQQAKQIAETLGIPYQTWIKSVITKAIEEVKNSPQMPQLTNERLRSHKRLSADILCAAKELQWGNPATKAFKPSDLKLDATQYGSFSDHCMNGETISSKYHRNQCLKPVIWNAVGEPLRYVLVFNDIRLFDIRQSEFSQYSEFEGKTGYSFEILGVMGYPDIALVCCQKFGSREEAQAVAEKICSGKYTHLPAEITRVFVQDTFSHRRIQIQSHRTEMVIHYAVCWRVRNEIIENLTSGIFRAAVMLALKQLYGNLKQIPMIPSL